MISNLKFTFFIILFFERPLIVIFIFILISFLVGMDLQAKRFYNKKETQIFHESEEDLQ